ncbi:hypothetical protein K2173_023795 [Erythroxylum novogranatense]|uniref:Uncharacterized protein n=1 Tax=Erythroxylum novogranatense TaxID=1862640 RepID=A0AAV8TKS1_9ROSI|nr:hypothetical protein K2173_023795 [Erythroxylum novogranatense]
MDLDHKERQIHGLMEFKWQSLPEELFPFICFFAVVGGVSLFGSENLRQGVIFFEIQSCLLLLTTVMSIDHLLKKLCSRIKSSTSRIMTFLLGFYLVI